jgi:hypothetical protein
VLGHLMERSRMCSKQPCVVTRMLSFLLYHILCSLGDFAVLVILLSRFVLLVEKADRHDKSRSEMNRSSSVWVKEGRDTSQE